MAVGDNFSAKGATQPFFMIFPGNVFPGIVALKDTHPSVCLY